MSIYFWDGFLVILGLVALDCENIDIVVSDDGVDVLDDGEGSNEFCCNCCRSFCRFAMHA
jgi:hypothetical protein